MPEKIICSGCFDDVLWVDYCPCGCGKLVCRECIRAVERQKREGLQDKDPRENDVYAARIRDGLDWVKIRIPICEPEDNVVAETVWALRRPDGLFEIRNEPRFCPVKFRDVVEATPSDNDWLFDFERVVGHAE